MSLVIWHAQCLAPGSEDSTDPDTGFRMIEYVSAGEEMVWTGTRFR